MGHIFSPLQMMTPWANGASKGLSDVFGGGSLGSWPCGSQNLLYGDHLSGFKNPFLEAGFSDSDFVEQMMTPGLAQLRLRNAYLDWLFYDVGALSQAELSHLLAERNQEGSILVVWPSGAKGEMSVEKFSDYESFRAAPGGLLQYFTIAGVGSSDIGAAAFARSFADHYDKPVGAIIAGYGVVDLMQEALGGWFVLGAANRLLETGRRLSGAGASLGANKMHTSDQKTDPFSFSNPGFSTMVMGGKMFDSLLSQGATSNGGDWRTLLRLCRDEGREIKMLAGHSKGCLSIAYALDALSKSGDGRALAAQSAAEIITMGAVVALPENFHDVMQYLGGFDGFGAMNSSLSVPHEKIPGAWHHLNTQLGFHMDASALLAKHH